MKRIVIIGGGTAGIATAVELRKLDKVADIIIIEKSGEFGYSPCSLPYLISGEIKEKAIFYTNAKTLTDESINVLSGCEATAIDRRKKTVVCRQGSSEKVLEYDRLVLALGSRPSFPHIEGLEHGTMLRNLTDARSISSSKGKRAVVIGAGLAGIEVAVALRKKGKDVCIVESASRVAPSMLDKDTSSLLRKHLESLGILVYTDCAVKSIDKETIKCHKDLPYDVLVLATGVKPCKELAEASGLKCGWGIAVDGSMRTSDKDVYACGECAQVNHFLSRKPYVSQSGVTAYDQAMLVASSIAGKNRCSKHVDSAVSSAGGLFFGSTGVTAEKALGMGIEAVTATYTGKDKSDFFPGASEITVKVVAHPDGRLIGCQVLAKNNISDMVNMASLAIANGLTVKQVSCSETCYNPAIAGMHHPLIVACSIAVKKLKGE